MNASDLANGSTPIDYLNADDVSNIEILKDASATSLYGSRAANGVILITTKNGKPGKAKINITVQQGMINNTLRDEQKTLNTDEYIQYFKEGWVLPGGERTTDEKVAIEWAKWIDEVSQ